MVKEEEIYQQHADLCKMLSNPIRLKILNQLREGEKPVGEITTSIGARQPTISQHLGTLRRLGLVDSRKEGTNVYYKISHPKIMKACDLIREVIFEQISKQQELGKGGGASDKK
ncbi:hypothetical protein AKJ47_01510 [candidate division MSBL1 archaeon SCGC-AAA261G05]|uniref:HTH arsR-type domain-containing protein n=2 Tax=candidate division MSBL1 TaxID=215777 RepID=A0A133V222_9EURY|nr:hypothetical protein AKJ42_00535 [candidate division MSBL1 archaeon SCGC-AAA261C02]KXB03859.1 hypothetical protein AKJ47_01510 [candidate division MSBL1 archaeon SCGC-AAA261G05]